MSRRWRQSLLTYFYLQVTWLVVTEVRSESFGPVLPAQHICVVRGAPDECYYNTLYYVAMRSHHPVWYRALSLRCACIRNSGIILSPYATFVLNFVSFAAFIIELAHGEKARTHSPSLFEAPGTEAFASENTHKPLMRRSVHYRQVRSVAAKTRIQNCSVMSLGWQREGGGAWSTT